jgi:hypothetical protein
LRKLDTKAFLLWNSAKALRKPAAQKERNYIYIRLYHLPVPALFISDLPTS